MGKTFIFFSFLCICFLTDSSYTYGQSRKYEVVFKKNISLYIEISDFDSTKHVISRKMIFDWSAIYKIDNQLIFGTDWGMPFTKLDKMVLKINKYKVKLDVSSMYNPWIGDTPLQQQFKLTPTEGGYFLKGFFSDGAGAYVAEWKIINDLSVRTSISSDEVEIMKFINHKKGMVKQAVLINTKNE
jgi:hypothetical protein